MKHRGKSPLAYRRLVFLFIALAINAVLLMWLAWGFYDSYGDINTMHQKCRIEEVRNTIVYLHEDLIMSARMAVLTGESEWEERYHRSERQLKDALDEAKTLAPTAQRAKAAKRTDAAHVELAEMETHALELLHQGRAAQARALLFGDRYRQQKQIYAEGMTALTAGLADIWASDLSHRRGTAIADIIAGALMIPLIVIAWALAFSAARSWTAERARTEKSLQFQATLLDQIRNTITATDMTGRITYVNAAQAAWTGRTKEELIGQPVEIYGSDPARGITQQEFIDKTIQHGHWQGELVNYAKDGTESLLHLHTWLIHDEDGNPTGMAGTGRDITEIKQAQYELQKAHDELEQRVIDRTAQLTQLNAELQAEIAQRKQAEQALRESEERHRTLFESSRDAIMTLAPPSWRFTSGNRATVEMFGAKGEQEFVSLSPWELSPQFQPDGAPSAEKARQMIETAVREGSHLFDWTHKRVGGEEFPATVLLTRMELGGQTLLQATVRDITNRVEAEQALRESEASLNQAQKLAHVGSWEWNLTDNSLVLSDELRQIYGLSADETFGDVYELVDRVIHPEDKQAILDEIARASTPSATTEAAEFRIVRSDGEVRSVAATWPYVQRTDASGKPTVLMGTTQDITERKAAEEALRESEQRYRAIFESAAEGILIADIETKKFLFANPAVSAMLGYSEGELLNMSIQDIHPPEDMPRNIARFEAAATGKTKVILDIPCLRKDGTIVFVDINTGTMLLDGRDYLIGLFTDVTERRQAERAVKFQAMLLDQIDDQVTATDLQGKITYVNVAEARDKGFTKAELIGQSVAIFGEDPDFGATQMEIVERTLRDGRWEGEIVNYTKGGERRILQVRTRLIHDPQGQPTALCGVSTDITDRKAAEDAVRESEKRHRQLVEGLNEGIAATDSSGIITFVNRAFAEIIGDSPEALVGSDFFGSTNDYQRDAFRRALLDGATGSGDYEVKLLRHDDKLLYLSMQGSPIMDDQGNHAGTLIVINDITKRREAEESLKATHRQLMFARQRERRTVARELHDSLGQQTIGMHLAIENMLAKAKASGDSYVDELGSLSQTCQMLANEIRTVCYGLYPPALEALGLCAALRQLGRESEHAVAVEVTCAPCLEETRLSGDVEIALYRIAQEAITNALRHGQAKTLTIDVDREGDDVILTVADDGVGFDAQQAESSGMGLRTMHERANAVGGELQIASQPGQTRVTARVPGQFSEMQT